MKKIEKKLLAMRAELLGDIAERDDDIAEVRTDEAEDKSGEWLEDEVLSALSDADRAAVMRVDAALARLAAGEYGICAECGEDIAPARLEAQPDAVLCIDCASKA